MNDDKKLIDHSEYDAVRCWYVNVLNWFFYCFDKLIIAFVVGVGIALFSFVFAGSIYHVVSISSSMSSLQAQLFCHGVLDK